ncbi:MAG: ABC transporter permease [Lachnospiraceae bacterium]|nr:ABC transporter permease [Lachnospiraceae bacterium]
MKKGAFTGWQDVFAFTWKQAVKGKGFKAATVGVALVFLIVGLAISTIMAFVQSEEDGKVSPVGVVSLEDESGLAVLYLDGFTYTYGEEYPNVSFVENAEEYSLKLKITQKEGGYLLSAVLPFESDISEGDAQDFLDDFTVCMEQSKLLSSGIPQDKLVFAMSGVSTEYLTAGEEEKSVGEVLVTMFVPMLTIFALYMMTLVYGQGIGNIVSVEKSSKLMEMVLTMTKPYALLLGKISATVVLALLQLGLWIVCLVGGFFGGHFIAETVIYPGYVNYILEVFELLSMEEGSSAFSVGAIVLCLLCLCIGFLFYCVLSGTVASFASKTEELAQCMAYYQIAVIIGFFGAYTLPLQEKEWLNTILRIFPLTSAYLLPGDILVGNVNVGMGVLYTVLLFVFTLALVLVAGKVYKNQLFHKGVNILERFKKKKAVKS